MSIFNFNNPSHTSFRTQTLFAPRHNVLSPARKFVREIWNMFSCCWTPVIRSSRATILFKFGSKAPLKEPSNLSLSLREGLRRFRSCKRGLESFVNWRQGISGHWFEQAVCSKNQTRNYWEACLLWGDSEGEKGSFVSPQFSVWFIFRES
jgi:hypothetical protein